MGFGITATGFNRKTEQDILTEIADDFRSTIGQVNDSDDSMYSQVVRPLAAQVAEGWEVLEAVYKAGTINGAGGISLDNLLANNFISRLLAKYTTVQGIAIGDVGAVIPANNGAKVGDTGALFRALAEVTIDPSDAMEMLITVSAVANSTAYAVTVNGTPYSATSAGSGNTIASIAALLVAALGSCPDVTVVDNLDGSFKLRTVDLITPFSGSVGARLDITDVGSPQVYVAVETGPIPCPAGELNTIDNPQTGFSAITNYQDGVLGRAKETDKEARVRRLNVLALTGKSTVAAIKAKLLSGDVPDITQVFVYENILDVTDADGRPPHSVEAVVAGGDTTLIAEAIHASRGGGINTYGNVNGGAGVSIIDGQGFTQIVKFSRPVNKYAHLSLEYTLYDEEIFPADGEAQIAAAVLAFGLANFPIGKNFIRQRFVGPAMGIPGISNVDIEIAVTSSPGGSPSFGSSDIAIGPSEVLVFDSTRITVAEAP